MKYPKIGEFEEIVLLTVGILHGNAYGITIKDEIESRLERKVSVGALQTTLRRLEKKGLLTSHHGETEASRGGRPKLFFTITAYGRNTLADTKESREKLWSALPRIVLNLK
ncbi:PadR family transcriptional regulator [Flexithrix dorotheae]|uniref:PadR family transcriptional regulator n=1 Tax=Flexithrix dorotheae TaxID=70993 RepID=UPI0003765135|nr:helix-turn-helix transcriptional regulator [Flexithrix dorotheae]